MDVTVRTPPPAAAALTPHERRINHLVLAGPAAALARARPARMPRSLPPALGRLGSGSLSAWSGWKLPATLVVALVHPAGATPPENPAAAALPHPAAVAEGAGTLRTLVTTDRRHAS
ncbi:hypothetical protein [Streptomyces sp. XH2]|uniref:hypothetical protein n=1 Tax=Streptomyces sp. XH2 TaxID=3412483 RepID=UPI003C7D8FBF